MSEVSYISACTCTVNAELLLPLDLLPSIATVLGKRVSIPVGRETLPGLFSRTSRARASPSCANAVKHVIAVETLSLIGLLPPNVTYPADWVLIPAGRGAMSGMSSRVIRSRALPLRVGIVPSSRSCCSAGLVVEWLVHVGLLPPIDSPLVVRILFPTGCKTLPGISS